MASRTSSKRCDPIRSDAPRAGAQRGEADKALFSRQRLKSADHALKLSVKCGGSFFRQNDRHMFKGLPVFFGMTPGEQGAKQHLRQQNGQAQDGQMLNEREPGKPESGPEFHDLSYPYRDRVPARL